ncbi:MAG: zinc ribbon domain-containing protein [Atribacterota bacterium]
MPTYEYVCTECGEKIEIYATISEQEKGLKVTCPKCGSKKVARVFGNIMVMGGSKGSGMNRPMSGCCGPSAGPGCCG